MAKRQLLGAIGEGIARQALARNYRVVAHLDKLGGDLHIVNCVGEIMRIEVKTASMSKDGKWRFRTRCEGHCDHNKSDVLLLLAGWGKHFTPFLIPVSIVATVNCVTISSHPSHYAGKYAKFRQNIESLTLDRMYNTLERGVLQ